jgi:dipeptidyl-peptidase-4
MLRRALFLSALLGTLLLSAQVKLQTLTLEDALLKRGQYSPERLGRLEWIPGTDSYSYVKGDTLMAGGVRKGADHAITTLDRLNQDLAEKQRFVSFPVFTWADANTILVEKGDSTSAYHLSTGTWTHLLTTATDAEREDMDAQHDKVAFTRGEDLFIAGPGDSITQVTTDGTDGIVNGRSVHREEYGITKGTFWSPDGRSLAFYRMDESMVTPYYLEDVSTRPSTFKKIRYPMAGQTSHQVTLGVYDTRTGKTVFIKTGLPADHYLTNITWDPDSKYIHIILLDRATDHFEVIRYDVATGEPVHTLFEENDGKWLEPEHPLTFLKNTPTRYIHWSQRDGWWHLYLYDVDLGMVRQLTKGPWVVKRILGFDARERNIFVEGTGMIDPKTPKGAMETHIYRVELATGKTVRLTAQPGTHHGMLSTDGVFLIDQWSSLTVPGRTEVMEAATGKVVKNLIDSRDPLAGMDVGTEEFVYVQGENGDVLNGRLIKPSGFQSRQRYPVIVYVYNGPHVQLVTNSWLGGASLWMLNAAQRGYLVFTVDGHGSADRGRDFEQAIYRQLGVTETKDQLHGVDYLKSLPYVDSDRLAVHGWSFGGHMTTALLLRAPGVFKAGVAGGAVMDWKMYEVMYTERYMDTPQEDPEGYAETALPDLAANLRDNLLLIQDNMDETVLPEHALTFLKSCVSAGVQLDFFMYPGYQHHVLGKDQVHLYTKILDYIDAKLDAPAN